MKKIIILMSIILIISLLTSCAGKSDIAAEVYGEKISVEFIQNKVDYSKEVYDKNVDWVNSNESNIGFTKEEYLEKLDKPKTFDEVLKEEIHRIVLLKEAEQKEIKADFEKCKQQAESAYETLMEIEKDDKQNYQSVQEIKKYMKENGLSKNEYINQLANNYYNNALINELKTDFMKNGYVLKDGAPTFEEQFEEYTKKLTKEAKVKYYN